MVDGPQNKWRRMRNSVMEDLEQWQPTSEKYTSTPCQLLCDIIDKRHEPKDKQNARYGGVMHDQSTFVCLWSTL